VTKVQVLVNVFNLADLIVGKISPFETCRRQKIDHLSEVIRTSVEFDEVLDPRKGFK